MRNDTLNEQLHISQAFGSVWVVVKENLLLPSGTTNCNFNCENWMTQHCLYSILPHRSGHMAYIYHSGMPDARCLKKFSFAVSHLINMTKKRNRSGFISQTRNAWSIHAHEHMWNHIIIFTCDRRLGITWPLRKSSKVQRLFLVSCRPTLQTWICRHSNEDIRTMQRRSRYLQRVQRSKKCCSVSLQPCTHGSSFPSFVVGRLGWSLSIMPRS